MKKLIELIGLIELIELIGLKSSLFNRKRNSEKANIESAGGGSNVEVMYSVYFKKD